MYRVCVDEFVNWCHANTRKSKEMIFNYRASKRTHQKVVTDGGCIEAVSEHIANI